MNASRHDLRWGALAVLCLSLLLVVLNNTVINVAIPTLARDLGATGSELQWIVDAYALVFGGLLLTMGALGDRYGRKGALQLGLLLVGAASVSALFATDASHLIVVRAIMGVGAALVMPATLSIIAHVFPREERGRAMGIWAGVAGLGGILGPVAGGWILERFSWSSIFLLNVPVVLAALAAGIFLVPRSRDAASTPLDPVGTVLSVAALSSLLFAIIEAPHGGLSSPEVLAAAAISAASWPAFIWWERRHASPMLPMSLFRSRAVTLGNLAIALAFFTMFALAFVMMQYLQLVRGYTAFEAGVRFLPVAAGLLLGAPNSDRLVRRFGTPRVVGTGLLLVALALSGLSLMETDTTYPNVAVGLFALGLGMGLTMAPSTTLIMDAIPGHKAGVGSALNDTSREVGGALGIAVLGSTLNGVYADHVKIPQMLPPALGDAARDSLGVALSVARQVGGAAGESLAQSARAAFVDALSTTLLSGAAVALLASILVFLRMPRRELTPAGREDPGESERSDPASEAVS